MPNGNFVVVTNQRVTTFELEDIKSSTEKKKKKRKATEIGFWFTLKTSCHTNGESSLLPMSGNFFSFSLGKVDLGYTYFLLLSKMIEEKVIIFNKNHTFTIKQPLLSSLVNLTMFFKRPLLFFIYLCYLIFISSIV